MCGLLHVHGCRLLTALAVFFLCVALAGTIFDTIDLDGNGYLSKREVLDFCLTNKINVAKLTKVHEATVSACLCIVVGDRCHTDAVTCTCPRPQVCRHLGEKRCAV